MKWKLVPASFCLLAVCSSAALARKVYTDEQRTACEADAMRLCKDDVPDQDRIIACMHRKQTQLSEKCFKVFKASARPKN